MLLALCLALLTVLVAGIHLWRLRQALHASQRALAQHHDAQAAALATERERVYADLHDDLGAKLLQLVYQSENPEHADLARTCLQDLRDVVSRSRGCPGSLSQTLSNIEIEMRGRLARSELELDWEQAELPADPELTQAQALHLFRIVREGVSNAIKHSQAQHLSVRVKATEHMVFLQLSDDGVGMDAANAQHSGVVNMRQRAQALAGHITWKSATAGGTRVILSMPLAATTNAPAARKVPA
jgi:signal transduction histidine kinase